MPGWRIPVGYQYNSLGFLMSDPAQSTNRFIDNPSRRDWQHIGTAADL
jgi:hypothetical protein